VVPSEPFASERSHRKKEVMNDFFFYALLAKHLLMNDFSAAQSPERTHMHRRSAVYVLLQS
jgi:hypothetical protein